MWGMYMDLDKAAKILRSFFEEGEELKFAKRTPIIHMNENSDHAYLITRGVVTVFSYDDTGATVIHYLFKENEIFPQYQLFSEAHYEVGFSAFTEVTVMRRRFTELKSFLGDNPLALAEILKQQTTIFDRVVTLNTAPAEKRLAKWLMTLSDRFGDQKDGHVDVGLSTTVQEFADCVRLSRESTGKILKNLECEGAIIMGRQRIIVFPNKLEEFVSAS